MNPVNWFEIPVKKMERAKAFYEKVLGLTLSLHEFGGNCMAWFPMGGEQTPGATGSLVQGEGYVPSKDGVLVYSSVEDIDATLGRGAAAGGKILLPKTAIGEYGFIGILEDTEGNRLGRPLDEVTPITGSAMKRRSGRPRSLGSAL